MTTSSEDYLEDFSRARIVSLMYKLTLSAKDTDELSIVFDRVCGRRWDEMTNKKNKRVEFYVRIMLEDVFSFAERQEKASYGLG